ncbi:MAG TPA: hypothetical protein VKV19_13055 [Ktedonobacteraceae bacterium]|nr:hypothetical protein [Ktedonobacteraceae bacterium]
MASHNDGEYLRITSEVYQEIVHHAVYDPMWSQYLLLINACLVNLKSLPTTPTQYSQVEPETLLIEALERLATAIAILLPGGIDEFRSYLREAAYRLKLSKDPILSIIEAINRQ